MSEIRFELDEGGLDDLLHGSEVEGLLQTVGDDIATRAAGKAPKETGAGAESIHCEVHSSSDLGPAGVGNDLPTAYVGWDQDHYYMGFAEVGTEHESARPFLRPALDETTL